MRLSASARRDPLLVADPLVFPLLVVAANLFVGRLFVGLDRAVFPHQPGDVLLPVLPRVATHDALHRRVGFQRRAVDPDRLARQAASCPRRFGAQTERLRRTPPAASRLRVFVRVEWSGVDLLQRNAQELPQAQAVGTAPGDAPLAVDLPRSNPPRACGRYTPGGIEGCPRFSSVA